MAKARGRPTGGRETGLLTRSFATQGSIGPQVVEPQAVVLPVDPHAQHSFETDRPTARPRAVQRRRRLTTQPGVARAHPGEEGTTTATNPEGVLQTAAMRRILADGPHCKTPSGFAKRLGFLDAGCATRPRALLFHPFGMNGKLERFYRVMINPKRNVHRYRGRICGTIVEARPGTSRVDGVPVDSRCTV